MNEARARFEGRFQEWTRLGTGADGNVYRVRDLWTGQLAVIKVADTEHAIEVLVKEYRLLSELRHPCIIESRDLIWDGGKLGHLLEYIPAVEPNKVWKEGAEEAVLAALTQSLRGLRFLHRHGYVHSDVAPGNILVWKVEGRWRAKLSDFGLTIPETDARAAGIRGTPGYMAPEVAIGNGFGKTADFYALAATVVNWIDGRGPWEGIGPKDSLQKLASWPKCPSPLRQVSPTLHRLIEKLGSSEPDDRTDSNWITDLRTESSWGPPLVHSCVRGLSDEVEKVSQAIDASQGIQSIIIGGRSGSGKRTLATRISRELVANRWSSIPQNPLETIGDWLRASSEDPDPVQMARELSRRFQDKDVVLKWPSQTAKLEGRVARAFVSSRQSMKPNGRTVVIRILSGAGDKEAAWIETTLPSRSVLWDGPDRSDLEHIREDLLSEASGDYQRFDPTGFTPASLIQRVRASLDPSAVQEIDASDGSAAEAKMVWMNSSSSLKVILAMLAWSATGWNRPELEGCIGESAVDWRAFEELERSGFINQEFKDEDPVYLIRDWSTKTALQKLAPQFPSELLPRIGGVLNRSSVGHGPDLELLSFMARNRVLPGEYAIRTLEESIQLGQYESVLDFWRNVLRQKDFATASNGYIWSSALRAALVLGQFSDVTVILGNLMEWTVVGSMRIDYRKQLAQAWFALGDWKAAIRECDAIVSDPEATPEDRAWAKLEEAEFLWQSGQFEDSESAYETAGKMLTKNMTALLIKKYVGQARQAGQQSDMNAASLFLKKGIGELGSGDFEKDPLYLHTAAGIAQAMESTRHAVTLSEKAVKAADKNKDWPTFVMASNRLSLNIKATGNLREAARRAEGAVSTAFAFGSERMAAMSGCSLGSCSLELGLPLVALRRARWAIEQGDVLEDRVLQHNGAYLQALTAAYCDQVTKLDVASEIIGRVRSRNYITYIAEARAIHELVRGNYGVAYKHLTEAIEYGTKNRIADALAGFHLLQSHVCFELGHKGEGEWYLSAGIKSSAEMGFDRLLSVGSLLTGVTRSEENADSSEILFDAVEDLWRAERMLPLCFWALPVMKRLSSGKARSRALIERRLIGAFQYIASNCDDDELRRGFLSAPRYSGVLKTIGAR